MTRLSCYAIILAGGSGTRLWPLARDSRPKPFLPLVRGRSLFRLTYERSVPLFGARRVLVVAGEQHRPWIRRETPEVTPDRILLEAVGRNTAAAVALAALWIRSRDRDGIMVVLPSDHFAAPAGAFRSAIRRAVRAAERTSGLVTIGVPARDPQTGFGYIRPSGPELAPGLRRASAFVEKPAATLARRMARSGAYLWNTGIFVWRAQTILEELRRWSPRILAPLQSWAGRKRREAWSVPAQVLRRVPSLPIDRAVLERSTRKFVLRAPIRWSDLGSWDALGEVLPRDRRGNAGLGRVVALDSSGCLGVNPGGTTVFVGVTGLAAIRSEDAVLVCDRRSAQRVREAVRSLRTRSTGVLQKTR